MGEVLKQVRQAIDAHDLVRSGEGLVVGVSGGPDSLCLLHVLQRLSSTYGLGLHVAHLHHGLRGAEADADARFVRDLAAGWGLPFTLAAVDVPSLAGAEGVAFEEAARRTRYAFLARTAAAIGSRTVAVGHNADDQAETVLMHFLRGSGLAGLRGMSPRTPLSSYRLSVTDRGGEGLPGSLDLIRPLLQVPRTAILAYCDEHNLEPRFDRSNLDTTYFRNWLRLRVMPLLEEHNPQLREVLGRTARTLAGDYDLLRDLLQEAWPGIVRQEGAEEIVFDRAAWRSLPTGLQRSSLREAIHRLRRSLRNINFVHVENALQVARDGTTGDRATLPQGLMLIVDYDQLSVAGEAHSPSLPDWPLLSPQSEPLAVSVPGRTPLPGSDWVLEATLLSRAQLPADWQDNRDPWRATLDAGVVLPLLWLRTRLPGDRFQPLGMGGRASKLGDFLTNQKVSRVARDRLALLVTAWGIAWVPGFRLDERARVGEATATILSLRFVRP